MHRDNFIIAPVQMSIEGRESQRPLVDVDRHGNRIRISQNSPLQRLQHRDRGEGLDPGSGAQVQYSPEGRSHIGRTSLDEIRHARVEVMDQCKGIRPNVHYRPFLAALLLGFRSIIAIIVESIEGCSSKNVRVQVRHEHDVLPNINAVIVCMPASKAGGRCRSNRRYFQREQVDQRHHPFRSIVRIVIHEYHAQPRHQLQGLGPPDDVFNEETLVHAAREEEERGEALQRSQPSVVTVVILRARR